MTETSSRIEISASHREVLDQVLDKWSVQILELLCEQPYRFNELRRRLRAPQKSLTATLRKLERNGVISREIVCTRPIAVRYSITPLGKTLREPIDAVLGWCREMLPRVEAARQIFDEADSLEP
ncbi:winged helix-turn-helix transcriptional regulator [Luteipulveratus halotolerans]|uniref:MarR family transcriptional regulator n=1 Tax=Luteipulveratus halotolerans TaxID=1631356 RepID=A0A0L6CEC7_9MICO|nr:helix-turn-helix domain-containing protein [Luteipulveratus halotolerans]KNX35858.1 MarR family transcriptional regulator [Luteipulveratus halotolerans]